MPQFTKNNFSWSCNLVAEYLEWHTQIISLGSKLPYPAEPSCQTLCQLLNAAVKKHTKSLVLRQSTGEGGHATTTIINWPFSKEELIR